MWWDLESDFSLEASQHNPFGPGEKGENTGGIPLKVPAFSHLTEAQAEAENVDTPEEIEYGRIKQQDRKRILELDETVGPLPKRSRKCEYSRDAACCIIRDVFCLQILFPLSLSQFVLNPSQQPTVTTTASTSPTTINAPAHPPQPADPNTMTTTEPTANSTTL